MITGTLGTTQSQPGRVQPGYFCTGIAVWKGPFPAQVSGTLHVTTAVASQMAVSDQDWWEFH